MKDNFSSQSDNYVKFRPTYPAGLVKYLEGLVPNKNSAWDVGTGNGQLAVSLSEIFVNIYATDISDKQLNHAIQAPNIRYSKQPAESTSFTENQFDLITVAQAIHWFDFDAFYREATRTLKQDGVIAIVGYGLLRINEAVDSIIDEFYHELVGPFWDTERKYIDEEYSSIPFPFEEVLDHPQLSLASELSLNQLLGYLNSWSAVQHYKNENGANPVDQIEPRLREVWSFKSYPVKHPLFMRIGMNGK